MEEFKGEVPIMPAGAEAKKENRQIAKKYLLLRFLIAGCVWLVVSGISLYVAWQQANHSIAWEGQWRTQHELENMSKAMIAFQEKFNSTPTNFEQLQSMTNEVPGMDMWFSEGFMDGWHHPFFFSHHGTDCLIISYGGDGKPGGQGIDYDLTTENRNPNESVPAFGQFLKNNKTQGMINSSFVCGTLAAFLSLLTVRIPNLTKRRLIIFGLSLCATVIGTLFVATIITALHMPSGH